MSSTADRKRRGASPGAIVGDESHDQTNRPSPVARSCGVEQHQRRRAHGGAEGRLPQLHGAAAASSASTAPAATRGTSGGGMWRRCSGRSSQVIPSRRSSRPPRSASSPRATSRPRTCRASGSAPTSGIRSSPAHARPARACWPRWTSELTGPDVLDGSQHGRRSSDRLEALRRTRPRVLLRAGPHRELVSGPPAPEDAGRRHGVGGRSVS